MILKPCPFCGEAVNLEYEFAGSCGFITCHNCEASGPCDEEASDPKCDIEAARDAWNRRIGEP